MSNKKSISFSDNKLENNTSPRETPSILRSNTVLITPSINALITPSINALITPSINALITPSINAPFEFGNYNKLNNSRDNTQTRTEPIKQTTENIKLTTLVSVNYPDFEYYTDDIQHESVQEYTYNENIDDLKDAMYKNIDDLKDAMYKNIDDLKDAMYKNIDDLKDAMYKNIDVLKDAMYKNIRIKIVTQQLRIDSIDRRYKCMIQDIHDLSLHKKFIESFIENSDNIVFKNIASVEVTNINNHIEYIRSLLVKIYDMKEKIILSNKCYNEFIKHVINPTKNHETRIS
jgi:hypothetical protein